MSVAIVQPAIVPDVDFKTPAGVTLNSASAKSASPKYIPFESALNIESPAPIAIDPLNEPVAADNSPAKNASPFASILNSLALMWPSAPIVIWPAVDVKFPVAVFVPV